MGLTAKDYSQMAAAFEKEAVDPKLAPEKRQEYLGKAQKPAIWLKRRKFWKARGGETSRALRGSVRCKGLRYPQNTEVKTT